MTNKQKRAVAWFWFYMLLGCTIFLAPITAIYLIYQFVRWTIMQTVRFHHERTQPSPFS